MREYKHICRNEAEAQEGIANLKAKGYKRTQNCYWVEWYEKEVDGITCRHVVIREF